MTDLCYFGTGWNWKLEPLIILCCYNWWTRVLELMTGEQLQRWTTRVREQFKTRILLVSRTWRRELTSVGPSGSEVKLKLSSKRLDLSRGVGPSGSEIKLELKKWPEPLRIGLLNYPGGWSFHTVLRVCFFRTCPLRYFLISINFISFQFSSFFFK